MDSLSKEKNIDFFIERFEKEYDRELEVKSSIESRSGIMIALLGTFIALFINGINLNINFTDTNMSFILIFLNVVKILLVLFIFFMLFYSFIKFFNVITTGNYSAINLSGYEDDLDLDIVDVKTEKLKYYNQCLDNIIENNTKKSVQYTRGLNALKLLILVSIFLGVIIIFT